MFKTKCKKVDILANNFEDKEAEVKKEMEISLKPSSEKTGNIEKIILNIAKTSNSWLQGLDLKVKSKPFYHSREKEKLNIQDWGNRFIKMLKEYT